MMPFYHSKLDENRSLQEIPSIINEDGNIDMQFTAKLQDYVSDQFAFRDKLVAADSFIKNKIFATANDSQVIRGKSDWLFYSVTLGDYAGVMLDDAAITECADKLDRICYSLEQSGKKPLVMIVPNKNSVYSEFMPAAYGDKSSDSNMMLLNNRLEELGVPYIDAYSVIMDGKSYDELYLHEDSHWNNTGARLVLNEIYRRWGLTDSFSLDDFSIEKVHEPDLYKILNPSDNHMENQRIYDENVKEAYKYKKHIKSLDDMKIVTQNKNGNGLSVFVYRDSFGRALIPYISSTFDESTYVRQTPYDISDALDSDCEYVLIEIVERNIKDLCDIEF